jgi:hypothetical protein
MGIIACPVRRVSCCKLLLALRKLNMFTSGKHDGVLSSRVVTQLSCFSRAILPPNHCEEDRVNMGRRSEAQIAESISAAFDKELPMPESGAMCCECRNPG